MAECINTSYSRHSVESTTGLLSSSSHPQENASATPIVNFLSSYCSSSFLFGSWMKRLKVREMPLDPGSGGAMAVWKETWNLPDFPKEPSMVPM